MRIREMGIMLRTALLCWMVSITTLLIFVAVVLPQQQSTFRRNLESKAQGIAVSLRDLTVGAVVNEDYGAVVDHCVGVLAGDPGIDHLVVVRNDGFALIHERAGWRMITNAPPDWLPARRSAGCTMGVAPPFGRRVCVYAHPFDYSGIQWGWIRVGLSLESYDASVRSLYMRTLVLAVVCIGLGLLVSIVYARRMVRPILALKSVVERVAGGDLAARAEVMQADEIGTLAGSVNAMAGALLRRDRILQAVHFAAQQFLTKSDWRDVLGSVLGQLGEAGDLCRIRLYQNQRVEDGSMRAHLLVQWCSSAAGAPPDPDAARFFSWQEPPYSELRERLGQGETIVARISEAPESMLGLMKALGVRSSAILPVFVRGAWWGTLALQDCFVERPWPATELVSFRAVADILGAAVERRLAEGELVEAKQTLERRVQERTRQLEEKVQAEEHARAELAEAQQRLIEASRRSGMAEVATGILHNVGNVLNSVNVSASLAAERLRSTRAEGLGRAAAIVRADGGGRAGQVADYIEALARVGDEERSFLRDEIASIQQRLEHVKSIVAMQQSHAKIGGVPERVEVSTLLEDAVKLVLSGREEPGFSILRDFAPLPPIFVEKHRVLQVLVNLIRNAEESVLSSGHRDGWIRLSTAAVGTDHIRIQVADNGRGIAREDLTSIFAHGFTTKPGGHGFGLHTGALAARELGGQLVAASDGRGHGATFILDLPIAPPRERT